MYYEHVEAATTGEMLEGKLAELNRCDVDIRIGEAAKEKKPRLLAEIHNLCLQLMDEEGVK